MNSRDSTLSRALTRLMAFRTYEHWDAATEY